MIDAEAGVTPLFKKNISGGKRNGAQGWSYICLAWYTCTREKRNI
jgi:hypothetical protein